MLVCLSWLLPPHASPSASPCVQETFDAGLQAFQQEGVANITALKDQLVAAKHVQSKAIEARHAALMKRWNQLLSNSEARKKKLLEAQEHFRKVRRLGELLCCVEIWGRAPCLSYHVYLTWFPFFKILVYIFPSVYNLDRPKPFE